MPTRKEIEAVLANHFRTWNAQDKEGWMANFSEDFVAEDPVGGLLKKGREAQEKSWENSFKDGHCWKLEPILVAVCANQAGLHVKNTGMVNGKPVEFHTIEVWKFNDDCKVCDCRTYFNPADGDEVDPYFAQLTAQAD
jgi:ketosteroid isomerase-like protein